jgi:hypothetical protein
MSHPPSYRLRVRSNTIAHFPCSLRIFLGRPRVPVADSRLLERWHRMPGQIHSGRQFTSFVLNTFMNAKEEV